MALITGTILKKIVPTLTLIRAEQLAEDMDFILPKYGINTPDILHEYIPNVAHESGAFRLKVENMNYSASRLLQVFGPKYFNTISAQRFAHQPQKIANYVYGGRMGNKLATDGWDFRGGGHAHLTGREMYQAYADYWATNIYKVADMVRTDDYWAADSAAWLFAIKKKLIQLAIDDRFLEVVRRWNGGYIGLDERKAYYERAKLYLK